MHAALNLTTSWAGYLSIAILVVAYVFVILEEKTRFAKSKPVLLAAGLIWLSIAIAYSGTPHVEQVREAWSHNFLEYAMILVFLLVAMTYINVLEDLKVFDALRSYLVRSGWSLRRLFWLTGGLAFCMSPVADNLTTALVMGAVVVAVGAKSPSFVAAACVNVVIAANAGGAFSPFGDITTLMVWQAGEVPFATFFHLIPAAVVTWLIPAIFMSLGVPNENPEASNEAAVSMRRGARRVMLLFVATIATAVLGHSLFHLPPVFGMLLGLAYLKIFGYFLNISSTEDNPFDVFHHIQRLEWDTLLFFAGIILAVGGIGFIGYLELLSTVSYQAWGPLSQEQAVAVANTGVGILSAIVDNIPLMFAVLTMDPAMNQWQWLLVTLTAGVGGSLLSIGSAAGVALMGASKGMYTFSSHLKYTPVIALGYVAAIGTHYVWGRLVAPYLFVS